MTVRTVHIPEDLFSQLETEALRASRSVDEIAAETIALGLSVPAEPDLPRSVRDGLREIEQLSDDDLWNFATSTIDGDTVAVFDMLAERRDDGELTDAGRRRMAQLLEEMDLFSLRKANAYAILRRRGHRLPDLGEVNSLF